MRLPYALAVTAVTTLVSADPADFDVHDYEFQHCDECEVKPHIDTVTEDILNQGGVYDLGECVPTGPKGPCFGNNDCVPTQYSRAGFTHDRIANCTFQLPDGSNVTVPSQSNIVYAFDDVLQLATHIDEGSCDFCDVPTFPDDPCNSEPGTVVLPEPENITLEIEGIGFSKIDQLVINDVDIMSQAPSAAVFNAYRSRKVQTFSVTVPHVAGTAMSFGMQLYQTKQPFFGMTNPWTSAQNAGQPNGFYFGLAIAVKYNGQVIYKTTDNDPNTKITVDFKAERHTDDTGSGYVDTMYCRNFANSGSYTVTGSINCPYGPFPAISSTSTTGAEWATPMKCNSFNYNRFSASGYPLEAVDSDPAYPGQHIPTWLASTGADLVDASLPDITDIYGPSGPATIGNDYTGMFDGNLPATGPTSGPYAQSWDNCNIQYTARLLNTGIVGSSNPHILEQYDPVSNGFGPYYEYNSFFNNNVQKGIYFTTDPFFTVNNPVPVTTGGAPDINDHNLTIANLTLVSTITESSVATYAKVEHCGCGCNVTALECRWYHTVSLEKCTCTCDSSVVGNNRTCPRGYTWNEYLCRCLRLGFNPADINDDLSVEPVDWDKASISTPTLTATLTTVTATKTAATATQTAVPTKTADVSDGSEFGDIRPRN